VQSTINRIASGRDTPGICPARTDCVTRSSSDRGERLYTPGKSTISNSAPADTRAAGVMLYGDAGEVRDLLAHSGEAVEQCGFA
jgi:hypothetical protein